MIKFGLDESKTDCKQAAIWCFGYSNAICNKFVKIQKYCKHKNLKVLKVFGSFSQNKDTGKAQFNEMPDFVKHQKLKTAVIIHNSNQFPKSSLLKKEIIKMIKDFYICLDNTALNYVLKHFSNPFTRIMRCYTGLEVEAIVKTMESNKSKNFYTLRAMQNKILKATIKNLEVLGAIFERADKGE